MYANDGFRELERQECLRLLAKVPLGRIVHTRGALPAVLPVNFGLDHDGSVLLRTSAASELVRAIDGSVVAFEADEVDAATHSGWSVVVTGEADGGDRPRRAGAADPDRAALLGALAHGGLRPYRARTGDRTGVGRWTDHVRRDSGILTDCHQHRAERPCGQGPFGFATGPGGPCPERPRTTSVDCEAAATPEGKQEP